MNLVFNKSNNIRCLKGCITKIGELGSFFKIYCNKSNRF